MIPSTGSFWYLPPSCVNACAPWPITGSALSATTVIPAYTPITAIRIRLTARGTSRPGSRASSAMFETVSIPVYASIASDSAKIRWLYVGTVPR